MYAGVFDDFAYIIRQRFIGNYSVDFGQIRECISGILSG